MPGVRLTDLTKRYGKLVAVQNLNLEVLAGELLTLLGPSGCGKTTILRCIAGFITPDEGKIELGKDDFTGVPPERRNIGFVFQNYALWPHMTVYQNLAFGLQLRKVPKGEIRQRVKETLALVRLSGLEDRYPRQLSGGQQQRVALARALIIQPRVLLLDEPLSNLDAKLREEMRFEIRELQRKLSITAIYVTHDQSEALALSDRIAVLNDGRLMQLGSPDEIYAWPANRFVASFIGLSSFVEAVVKRAEGSRVILETDDGLEVWIARQELLPGQKVVLAVRPEHTVFSGEEEPHEGVNWFHTKVLRAAYLGDVVDCQLRLGKWDLRIQAPPDRRISVGQKLWLKLIPERIIVIPRD
jgi:iron(III) transport system ATP-binding protein